MHGYHYTLNVQAQAYTMEDLIRTMDEMKNQIACGWTMAYDKDKSRRYAL